MGGSATSAGERRWLAAGGALLALMAVGYLAVAAWAGTRTAQGTTVAGVDVGNLDRTELSQRLEREVAPREQAPVTLTAGSGRATLVPADAGLTLDVPGTVRSLSGFTLRPQALWRHVQGGGPSLAVTTTDRTALTAAVAKVATKLDQKLVQGSITFGAQGAVLRPSVEGRAINREAAADTLETSWYQGGNLALDADITRPKVAPAVLQKAFDDLARPAGSGPLRLEVGDRAVSVPLDQLAPTLSVDVTGEGAPVLAVDGAALRRVVVGLDPQLEQVPVDATLTITGGKPVVTEARTGQRLDPQALAAAVLPALTRAGRTAVLEPTLVQPKRTTADLRALGVKELVSTFTTQFPVNPPRTTNIRIAAGTLNGMLVEPGETFSLNAALGERTPAKGYQKAPVISGGRLETDYGGGVSQVSTTLFNAVFFAGLDTVAHKPHSFYISRYPEGREATLSFPTVDQKFRNDSGNGILITTAVSGDDLTVTFWGTKVWDVTATKGPRTNVTPPRTIHDTDGSCVAQSPSPGFDVVVTRVFGRGGVQVKTERFSTRYVPEDRVICG